MTKTTFDRGDIIAAHGLYNQLFRRPPDYLYTARDKGRKGRKMGINMYLRHKRNAGRYVMLKQLWYSGPQTLSPNARLIYIDLVIKWEGSITQGRNERLAADLLFDV
jgi:hypothetical protein